MREDEVSLTEEESEVSTSEISDVVVADLVEEHRKRRQEAEEEDPPERTNRRYQRGVVEDVTPKPRPNSEKEVSELVEDGYKPKKVQFSVRTSSDDIETITYRWLEAKDVLNWYGDGTMRSLVSENVIVDTEEQINIELPEDTNLRTSRASHRLQMLLHYHLGLSQDQKTAIVGSISLVLSISLMTSAISMPILYPENPPLWAVAVSFLGFPVSIVLFWYASKAGLIGHIVEAIRSLNRVDD